MFPLSIWALYFVLSYRPPVAPLEFIKVILQLTILVSLANFVITVLQFCTGWGLDRLQYSVPNDARFLRRPSKY